MSRLLLLNLEDFGLAQDITKTIKPYKPFCICCLGREGPMFNLEKCSHADYLDGFFRPELKQLKQLVCVCCHSMMKKMQRFQAQVLESCELLLSGAYTETTINTKKVSNLIIETVVNDLHLPPNQDITEIIDKDFEANKDKFSNIVQELPTNTNNMEHNFTDELRNNSNMEQNIAQEIQNNLNLEQNFTHEFQNGSDNLNMEHNFVDEIESNSNLEQDFVKEFQSEPIVGHNFTNDNTNMEQNLSEIPNILNEEQMSQAQNRLNKNIKTALEILERNNQSFVGLSSQLQFLNGEHLSFLETSLLSKEILTDIPLVPAKNTSTDFGNELTNNSKSLDIEIDGTDKMFYDSLGLSPELDGKETMSEIISNRNTQHEDVLNEVEHKKSGSFKPKKKKERQIYIQRVTLSHAELDRERVALAQTTTYSNYKFRCETCIVGFNFKENLDDHNKRKHGPIGGESVKCEICSQTIPSPGHASEHYYRHYTRYECVCCHKKFPTLAEAQHHCRSQCGKAASIGYKVKKARISRKKLKLKPSAEES